MRDVGPTRVYPPANPRRKCVPRKTARRYARSINAKRPRKRRSGGRCLFSAAHQHRAVPFRRIMNAHCQRYDVLFQVFMRGGAHCSLMLEFVVHVLFAFRDLRNERRKAPAASLLFKHPVSSDGDSDNARVTDAKQDLLM